MFLLLVPITDIPPDRPANTRVPPGQCPESGVNLTPLGILFGLVVVAVGVLIAIFRNSLYENFGAEQIRLGSIGREVAKHSSPHSYLFAAAGCSGIGLFIVVISIFKTAS